MLVLLLVIALSSLGGFLIDANTTYAKPVPKLVPPPLGEVRRGLLYPTPHNVWHYIRNHPDLLFDSLVYKKVINETGLKTKWLLAQNNLTCMRLPKKRNTTAIGEKYGYAVYSTWQSCIDDYALFQKMFHGKTIDDYYNFLQTYGDSNYVHNLKTNKITFPK